LFRGEDKALRRFSWTELGELVSRMQQALKAAGVQKGDRIAAMLPNLPESVALLLAVSSIGAIFSSCSPDFGERGVVDRFGQIEPKLFFVCDGYWYNGKKIELAEKAKAIVGNLPSVEKVVVIPYLDEAAAAAKQIPRGVMLADFLQPFSPHALHFERLPFDYPLYILYSSGTTGVPKCIVHGAGGMLLQHLKEHRLHCAIKPGERVFYFSTLGWMMWNWLVSALASEATLCLYDGSPFAPDEGVLFRYAEDERINLFGTSAKYIDAVKKSGLVPKEKFDLSSVRTITSTGSPLAPESFDFVYDAIKGDVHLASISGGTDLGACFVLGEPTSPVWKGEIQAPGLGMAVDVWSEDGKPVRGERGELVCTKAFPSMPVQFWNDPGGVRIGTAEIYAQVEQIPEIMESIAIGQEWDHEVRIVLFVKMREGAKFDDAMADRIKKQIRSGASPRHVPARVVAVADIPRTRSGKITEIAVREVVHGRPVKNTEALANPEALAHFKDIPALKN
jgi:acetoacetyl-CoA synthetase